MHAFVVRPAARDGGARAWSAALAGTRLDPREREERVETLLDGPDHRLARAGLALACAGTAPRVACRLASLGEAPEEPWFGTFELPRPPRFVWDLPRAQAVPLAETLEARALEPLGELDTTRARWAVLDEEHKVVTWIEDERQRLTPPAGEGPAREVHRLVVRGVRGYDAECARVAALLEGAEGLARAGGAEPVPAEALLPLPRRRPGRWAPLAPGTRAFPALARIVRAQLEVLRRNAPGLRAGADAEYLHDTRVALRRLRSLLGQLDGILPEAEQAECVAELRALARATGPARDADTLLFELHMAPPELAADLGPVLAALAEERERMQAELVAALEAPRARRCLRGLRTAFAAGREQAAGPRAGTDFARVVAKRLRRRLRQVLARAAEVRSTSPGPELHALRIACKKLRYLLECCRGLVPAAELEACVGPLKGLQGVLGTIQDVEVHGEALRALALGPAAGAGPAAHLALGRFLEQGARRGRAARARYEQLADALLAPPSRAAFEHLRARLRPEPGTGA
ncbi:MAG TPA: CHAD domain-containing protein [Planctomycetota bacterium]